MIMETLSKDSILGPESIKSNFDSQAYLWDFYERVEDSAMQMMIMLLPTIAERISHCDSLLDFGAGPTIHVSVAFRNKVNNIYLADYLPQNRRELFRWTIGESSFDWTSVLKMIATVEGSGWLHLKEMEEQTRAKVVVTILCLEYCSSSVTEYKQAVWNVAEQVKPGGCFVMGGVLEETWCSFGGRKYSCLYVTEELLFEALRDADLLVDDPRSIIYYMAEGTFLVCCKKKVPQTNTES